MKKKWMVLAFCASTIGAMPAVSSGNCYRPWYTSDSEGNDVCHCIPSTNGIGYGVCYEVSRPFGGTSCAMSFPCTPNPPSPF